MPAIHSSISAYALQNTTLTSTIFSKQLNQKLSVVTVAQVPRLQDPSKVYIVLETPNSDQHHLKAIHCNNLIGECKLSLSASNIENITNYSRSEFKGIGTALTEVTARLALRSGHTSIDLYAISAVKFHFKMGARFKHSKKNQTVKNMIAGSQQNKHHLHGLMKINLAQRSSGSSSPRLIQQIVSDEISTLNI